MKNIILHSPILGRDVPIEFIVGEVLSSQTRTTLETRQMPATAVGTRVIPGQIYSEAVDVTDCWLRLEDGKEMKLPFQPGIDMRAGHQVVFVVQRVEVKGRADVLTPIYEQNKQTGETYANSSNVGRDSDYSDGAQWFRVLKYTFLIMAIFCGVVAATAERGAVGVAALVTLVFGTIPAGFVVFFVMDMLMARKIKKAGKQLMPEVKAAASLVA